MVICLFVWMTVAGGVDDAELLFMGNGGEALVAVDIGLTVAVVVGVTGAGGGGDERTWNFSCKARILLATVGRLAGMGATLA